jgi:hypothetical protein
MLDDGINRRQRGTGAWAACGGHGMSVPRPPCFFSHGQPGFVRVGLGITQFYGTRWLHDADLQHVVATWTAISSLTLLQCYTCHSVPRPVCS